MLTAQPLAKGVELCATICLVPADMHEQLWGQSEQYVDQVYSADVLVLNRQDRVHDISKVETFIRDLFPPKIVGLASHAEFDPALLEADPAMPHDVGENGVSGCTGPTRVDCGDGSTRLESTREGRRLVGWIFDAAGPQAWLFNRAKLETGLAAFAAPPLDRAKAIFQTRGRGVLLAHWGVAMPLILETVPAVRDSRVRVLCCCRPDFLYRSSLSSSATVTLVHLASRVAGLRLRQLQVPLINLLHRTSRLITC